MSSFAEALAKFFAALPDTFRYGVEIRQAQFLDPECFRALRENSVTHVFNSWTEMPGIDEQISESEAFTTNLTGHAGAVTARRRYENSVRMFSPNREIKEPNAEVRAALRSCWCVRRGGRSQHSSSSIIGWKVLRRERLRQS